MTPGPHNPLVPGASLGGLILLNRSVFSFTGVVILGAGCGLAWEEPDEPIPRRATGNSVSTVRHSKIWLAMSQMGQEPIFEHEATTSKISEDMLFYCRQRGMSAEEATALVVNGFVKDVLQHLPMEFAVEAQKLIAISLEGSVG
jgi:hypothetical protein